MKNRAHLQLIFSSITSTKRCAFSRRLSVKSKYLLPTLLVASFSVFGNNMCNVEDRVIFSCEMGNKNVSACLTPNATVNYIYGKEDKVEIKLNSPVFSSTFCPGGGMSRLRFQNGDYSYVLYDVMCNSRQVGDGQWSKSEYSGLLVLNRDKVIAQKYCTGFEDDILGINSGILPKEVQREEFNYDLP